ncbi:hypothetical protein V8E36_008957 [Tilletia maclaganii]
MRLIAVPLARLRPGTHPVSTFLAQRAPVVVNPPTPTSADGKAADAVPVKRLPLASRLSARASAFWLSLGAPNTKSTFDWKRRTYNLGERIMDRIEYEEWALKGIDPALAPSIKHPTKHQSDAQQSTDSVTKVQEQTNIPLLYPPSLLQPNALLSSLRTLTEHRTPYHRKRMWVCLIGAPLTAPFALVPVIPNLPFFYLAWRAWSHWKAYQSSAYLTELIAQNRLVPTPSKQLDDVFTSLEFAPRVVHPKVTDSASPPASPSEPKDAATPPDSTPSEASAKPRRPDSPSSRTELLLTSQEQIKRIITALEIDEKLGLATELRRAMEQTLKMLEKGETKRLEAAAAGVSAPASAASDPKS